MNGGRIAEQRNERWWRTRAQIIPIASTMGGSAFSLLPFIAVSPVLPPFGLLMLLGWRLLRPELWPAWIALPLGLADDLIGARPLGSSMVTWTITLLLLDAVDNRPLWRDYWMEWLVASGAILLCAIGGWLLARFTGGGGTALLIVPQTAMAIFCFPATARLCAALDGWRLRQ